MELPLVFLSHFQTGQDTPKSAMTFQLGTCVSRQTVMTTVGFLSTSRARKSASKTGKLRPGGQEMYGTINKVSWDTSKSSFLPSPLGEQPPYEI